MRNPLLFLALTLVSAVLFLLSGCGAPGVDCVLNPDAAGCPGDDDTAGGLAPVSFRLEAEIPFFPGTVENEGLLLDSATYMVGAEAVDPGELVQVSTSDIQDVVISLPGKGHAPCQVRRVPDPNSPNGVALKVTLDEDPTRPDVLREFSHEVDGGNEFTIHDGDTLTVPLNVDLAGVWDCEGGWGHPTEQVQTRFGGQTAAYWADRPGKVAGHLMLLDYTHVNTGWVEARIAEDGRSWVVVDPRYPDTGGCEVH